MPTYVVNGIPVDFPHPAYTCQIDYMSSVMEALNSRQNGLLESPTGTGKTLSLLCSVLAWLKHNQKQLASQGEAVRIYYTSRTHSQLKQVVKEFRRTSYGSLPHAVAEEKPADTKRSGKIDGSGLTSNILTDIQNEDESVSMTVLGSRDQLCVHPRAERVSSSSARTAMCNAMRSGNKCRFFLALNRYKEGTGGARGILTAQRSKAHLAKHAVGDIEDLAEMGRTHEFCPFYLARRLSSEVDIVFAPYNYLVDKALRTQIGVDLQNSIIIIDEAHNLASQTTQACSVSVTDVSLGEAVADLNKAAAGVHTLAEVTKGEAEARAKRFQDAAEFATRLVLVLGEIMKASAPPQQGDAPVPTRGDSDEAVTQSGEAVLGILRRATVKAEKSLIPNLLKTLDDAVAVAAETSNGMGSDTPGLDRLKKFLSGIQTYATAENQRGGLLQSFRTVCFRDTSADKKYQKHGLQNPIELGLWCVDAGVAMRQMITPATSAESPPRSILVTSGTLSPLDYFAQEMGIPFPVRLSNPHVIQSTQIMALAVRRGMNEEMLSSRFANRKNARYVQGLGQSIAKLCSLVPDGLLVFFQSFSFMREMIQAWKQPGTYASGSPRSLYDVINRRKLVIEEAQTAQHNAIRVEEFRRAVDYPGSDGVSGAVLFAVFRGKMSEGMDFPDKHCRGVAIVGIPYASRSDLRVKLKMEVDSKWYMTDALRSVNQAIGRVIRHSRDHGCVYLLDDRYATDKMFNSQLPQWVLQTSRIVGSLSEMSVQDTISRFYDMNRGENARHIPPPEVPCVEGSDGNAPKRQRIAKSAEQLQQERDAAERAIRSARIYSEMHQAEGAAQRQAPTLGTINASLFSSASASAAQPTRRVGAVPVKQYTPQEFRLEVRKVLTSEQYSVWKALLHEFAASLDNATVFMDTRFVPWLVGAFTEKHHLLLRAHACTLPESLRAEYLTLLRQHLRQRAVKRPRS